MPRGGPDEVRALSDAMERMQARISGMVADRTRMLAALGHDLRSPITALRLRAEMKLPGRAWLQFEVRPEGRQVHLEQTAFFEPHGLLGNLYWHGMRPFHRFLVPGLIEPIQTSVEA